MRNFLKEIKDKVLVFDGSKGTMLQRFGLSGGECPELWNVTNKEAVRNVYTLYKQAGADVIQTNTFQGNRIRLTEYGLGDRTYELNHEAARLAKEVMGRDGFVAGSVGPLGILFEPSGELTFDRAYEVFREQVKALVDGGVDIINFETFTDIAELRAAIIAYKDVTNIPLICSVAFEANGKTLMGTDPYTAAVTLKSLGADVVGTNCSLGVAHLLDIVKEMAKSGAFICAKPNAGLPEVIDGKTVYKEVPSDFASFTPKYVESGTRLLGGCCGTDPEYIKEIKRESENLCVPEIKAKPLSIITSLTNSIDLDEKDINKITVDTKDFMDALVGNDTDAFTDLALSIKDEEPDLVIFKVRKDAVNFHNAINVIQGFVKAPFVFETESPKLLESVLRIYKGKAGVSVERLENIQDILAVAKRYGSFVITSSLQNG